jgi:hypothetical protein
MNRRLACWLLALYPSAWRGRYGPEVASLNEELIALGETSRLRAGLNLVTGAAIERQRALARSPRAALTLAAAAVLIAAGITFAVVHTAPGPASASAVTLNCFVAKPAAPAGGLRRAQDGPAGQNRPVDHGRPRHRPACPGGQLRWVHHGPARTQLAAQPLRRFSRSAATP